jgi:hypothetical protein
MSNLILGKFAHEIFLFNSQKYRCQNGSERLNDISQLMKYKMFRGNYAVREGRFLK